ncbi:hypothetical protein BV25DRAFT_1326908 [Artomyces pyxidatus]|uniref:Uncharacterized protein n=1 Tax=Artomyces pyxidatus TaxID=48021 RepID=A0ACB8SP51_9AGAM|nr:hypothetical protein BV25DRAFT_1326908 [Artomyces pyxidatus]
MVPSDSYKLPDGSDFITAAPYTVGESHGVITLIVVACFSFIAVVLLLSAIAMSAFNTRTSKNPNLFVRTHIVAYFISLLTCDILQAIGSMMNSAWVREMGVYSGTLCTIQGVIKHFADVGIAIWSLIIALHTFFVLFLRIPLKRRYTMWCTLAAGWSAIGAIVIAGPATLDSRKYGPYYGVSGNWCWITEDYGVQRIALDYMIMFLSALFAFCLYSLVFLRLRGKLQARPVSKLVPSEKERQDAYDVVLAKQMLLYPVAYTLIILPIAAARFSVWSGHDVPFGVTIFCDTIYLLMGVVNTVLFVSTRRILPPQSVIPKFLISKPELIESTNVITNSYDPYYVSDETQAAGNFTEKARGADLENPFSSPEDGLHVDTRRMSLTGQSDPRMLTDASVIKHVHSPDSGSDGNRSALPSGGSLSPMSISDYVDVPIDVDESDGEENARPVVPAAPLPYVPPLAPKHGNSLGVPAAGSSSRVVSATPTTVMEYYYESNEN